MTSAKFLFQLGSLSKLTFNCMNLKLRYYICNHIQERRQYILGGTLTNLMEYLLEKYKTKQEKHIFQ